MLEMPKVTQMPTWAGVVQMGLSPGQLQGCVCILPLLCPPPPRQALAKVNYSSCLFNQSLGPNWAPSDPQVPPAFNELFLNLSAGDFSHLWVPITQSTDLYYNMSHAILQLLILSSVFPTSQSKARTMTFFFVCTLLTFNYCLLCLVPLFPT